MEIKLDKKDRKILEVLDKNFRIPLSKVAKEVGLSKNSVALRFNKLKSFISHTTTGINNKMLGYTLIKVYYSINSLSKTTEQEIMREFKKHKSLFFAARLYGHYNLEIAFMVNDIDDFINQLTNFNEKFNKKINEKEIQIIINQYFFRNNFLYDRFVTKVSKVFLTKEKIILTKVEKKIISIIRYNAGMNLLDIAEKTNLNPKTVSNNLKSLEKRGIIMGYYMSLDTGKLGLNSFKILLQIDSSRNIEEFDEYLTHLKDAKHIAKMLGLWDYEIDLIYKNTLELQKQIEFLRQKFPKIIKKIEIVNFRRRMITSKEMYLK